MLMVLGTVHERFQLPINGSEIIRPLNQNRANIFSDLYYKLYMISSHDETQPETPPTSAATSPNLPSSPLPSPTISVEGSVDGPVAGSVDGIVKERIKKRKRTTTAEQLLKDAISHYSDLRENWCKSRLRPNTKKTHISHPR
ncbi:hypothetical protein ABEB36_011542 [Hypothenemus hampei]|uniref:Uncharacterized protein n=1 Tax=Hypothenemus hampei TaxID=57062 RepID=A0ABD1E868_HYPHA